jgi:hypothetical protein
MVEKLRPLNATNMAAVSRSKFDEGNGCLNFSDLLLCKSQFIYLTVLVKIDLIYCAICAYKIREHIKEAWQLHL